MFRLTTPDAAAVSAFLAEQRDAPFSYDGVGATRGAGPVAVPPGYTRDHRRVRLGTGEGAFVRAVAALRAWRMLSLGWAQVRPAGAPQTPGTVVAVVVRHYGFASLHAARIVHAFDAHHETDDGPVRRVGFAYGTLPGHAARGEERFTVEWRARDDAVWYDLLAFSRPGHLLMRLGRPLARRQQRRFGRDSARAMLAAVGRA